MLPIEEKPRKPEALQDWSLRPLTLHDHTRRVPRLASSVHSYLRSGQTPPTNTENVGICRYPFGAVMTRMKFLESTQSCGSSLRFISLSCLVYGSRRKASCNHGCVAHNAALRRTISYFLCGKRKIDPYIHCAHEPVLNFLLLFGSKNDS